MKDLELELQEILENDPLGLLNVKPKSSGVMTADKRLIASFEEITKFVEENGQEPSQSRDINERRLYSRLKAIRENPEKAAALSEHDTLNLLADDKLIAQKEIKSVDDILEDDALGLLNGSDSDTSDPEDIFILKNVPAASKMPDFVAKRKACKEFDKFEPLFKKAHAELRSRARVTRPFNSEQQITPNSFFIVQGIIVYVAKVGNFEKKNFGNKNARLYCVFENGTESNMLLRSLAAALWKDETSREIVDANQYELFKTEGISETKDEHTGSIYVLQSLSEDPKVKETKDLYKIGYSKRDVELRIKDAKKDPTYLFSDVKVIAEFEVCNIDPQKLELLLHKFFAESCLELDVFDDKGKRFTPREWFVAPLHVIRQAIGYILSEEIVQFRFDPELQEIVRRKSENKEQE